jgi:sporulation-control protein spo0M
MVLGIGAGKMELRIPTQSYAFGDTVSGTLYIDTKKPVKARKLIVKIECKRITKERYYHEGRRKTRTRTTKVWGFVQQLGDEQEYVDGEHPFSIELPPPFQNEMGAAGDAMEAMGTGMQVLNALSGQSHESYLRWKIEGRLDMPWAIDIKKKLDLSVN